MLKEGTLITFVLVLFMYQTNKKISEQYANLKHEKIFLQFKTRKLAKHLFFYLCNLRIEPFEHIT